MKHKLLQLIENNKGARQPMRADTTADGVHVYVYDVIDSWFGASAADLIKALEGAGGKTVYLHINSPGGDVFEARAMAAAITAHDGEVVAKIDGLAASAATYLALSASSVEIIDGGMFMIHNAWTLAMGDKNELTDTASLLGKIDGLIANDYAKKTGKALDDVVALMDAETWMTAQEALDAGFVDVVNPSSKSANKNSTWNLSAYKNAPQIAPASDPPEDINNQINSQLQMNRNRLALFDRI